MDLVDRGSRAARRHIEKIRYRRRRGVVVFAMLLSVAGPILSPTGSLAQGRPGGLERTLSPAARLPSNYRQLMAQYIRANNRYVMRDAKITKPYERYGGLFRGGTIPAVCVAVFRDNPFGIVVRDNWVMTIENGRVLPIAMGMESCSELSPFTELTRR